MVDGIRSVVSKSKAGHRMGAHVIGSCDVDEAREQSQGQASEPRQHAALGRDGTGNLARNRISHTDLTSMTMPWQSGPQSLPIVNVVAGTGINTAAALVRSATRRASGNTPKAIV